MGYSAVSCFQLEGSSVHQKCKGLGNTLFPLGLNLLGIFHGKEKKKRSCDEKLSWVCLFPSLACSVLIHYSSMVSASKYLQVKVPLSRFRTHFPREFIWQSSLNSGLLNKMCIITWSGPAKWFSQNNMYQSLSGEILMPVHLHEDFTAACPEMFLALLFNTTLNI